MSIFETSLFYLVVGIAVSAAMYLREENETAWGSAGVAASALFFWPLYVPVLLSPRDANRATKTTAGDGSAQPVDDLADAIAQVEEELATALAGLSGWAEDALAREQERIAELQSAWRAQAQRIREIDLLLAHLERDDRRAHASKAPAGERLERSETARQRNFARLARVRSQAHDDLLATLAWVRELVSMIHLARFTGAPASRAEELVAQIAAAVAGVSAFSSNGEADTDADAESQQIPTLVT